MDRKFSPSINIERDSFNSFDFITTPNIEKVISDLDFDFGVGIHCFSIIGSYGTGKSSFLMALEKHFTSKNQFTSRLTNFRKKNYKFLKITSEYASLASNINRVIGAKSSSDFIAALGKEYKIAQKENQDVIVLVDEFGKILEYASKHNPEKEVFDIQRLSEFVNSKNILLIITLHQAFDSYAFNLTRRQRDEWIKVKGRIKDIPFNEPVEQLLYLAAEKLNNGKVEPPKLLGLLKSIRESNSFPFRNIHHDIAKKLFPLDLLTAATLTMALQKYGQNERSLFTFLYSGFLNTHSTVNGYFGLPDLYDYLHNNFYHYLISRYNRDYINWQSLNNSLQRAQVVVGKNHVEIERLLKTIGLLNIFSSKSAQINKEFLSQYLLITYNMKDVSELLNILVKHQIIKYLKYRDTYILFEGTDFDIEYELIKAEESISIEFDLADKLKEYLDFSPVLARSYYYIYGTPRYFQFIISNEPIRELPKGEFDGVINVVVNSKTNKKVILSISSEIKDAIIYGYVKNSDELRKHVLEIEKVNYLFANHTVTDDSVAQRHLTDLKMYYTGRLNDFVEHQLFTKNSMLWYYEGNEIDIQNKQSFNHQLSLISGKVYSKTPVYKNELINREDLPGNISTARKNLLSKLIISWDKEDLEFPQEKFPPEKSIYLTLLKNTGIHAKVKNNFFFNTPSNTSFLPFWNECEKFLNDSKNSKKNLYDLIETLSQPPYGLRKGLVDFWLSIWIFIKRNDFALYDQKVFIPEISADTIDLILKKPSNYYIKSFDLGGIRLELFNKYRELINMEEENKIDKKTFIETIKPFLTFYRTLPEYSKQTKRLSTKAIKIRDIIVNSKDPEQTFFEDFPNALGFTTTELHTQSKKLEQFINELKNSIKELRTAYAELVNRTEETIRDEFGYQSYDFNKYKNAMQLRFSSIKQFSLLPKQKTIYQRIYSNLDECDAWINSLVQSLIGKQLYQINDSEEELIYKSIRELKTEFDNLCEFAKLNIDERTEDAIKIEISSLKEGLNSKIIRLPKNQNGKYAKVEKSIKKELSGNYSKDDKIFLLLKLLKEELNEK